VIQTRSKPALLRKCEDVGMATLERMRRYMSGELCARFSMEGHGHVVAMVAVVIVGSLCSLRALSLQADDEPLQAQSQAQ